MCILAPRDVIEISSDEEVHNPRVHKDGNLYLQITFHLVLFSTCCLINNGHYLCDSFCDTRDRDIIEISLSLMSARYAGTTLLF